MTVPQPYRPPHLERAHPGVTPRGWYTVDDGRELWWDGYAWILGPPHLPARMPNNLMPADSFPASRMTSADHIFQRIMTLMTFGRWAKKRPGSPPR